MAEAVEPPAKKMRLAYHHRHKIQHKQQEIPQNEPATLQSDLIDKLFIDSIATIGLETALELQIQNPYIEVAALEGIHCAAEEFMTRVCAKVRRSMLAARRNVPLATDFESAFDVLDLPRPDEQLPRYRQELEINPPLLPTPPPDDTFHNYVRLPPAYLGPQLSKQGDLKKYSFNTTFLPPLPSSHTYKDTSVVYSEREKDSRKIREAATEEGKLGEQALRKLAGAVKLDAALSTEPETQIVRAKRGPRRRQPALSEEAMFEETMRDLLKHESGDFELGPVVTSEKQYRMPDEARVKRRPVHTNKSEPEKSAAVVDTMKRYNLMPPPLKKEASNVHPSDRMDTSFEL